MRSLALLFFALLSGCAVFIAATGLLSTTLALEASARGFPESVTGIIMAAYFAGFVVGTCVGPRIIGEVGHIRAFSVFAAVAAASVLLHPLFLAPITWTILRFITGASVVGLYMVSESWLNEKATNQSRGRIFATYQIISLLSLAVGQWLLLIGGSGTTPFLICGVLFAVGLVPVALTKVPEPSPIPRATLDLSVLWAVSPLGVLGAFMTALANGVFFSLGPVFAQRAGFSVEQVLFFMSLVILGGVALQWPIGHLSDGRDRRIVILMASAAAAVLATLAGLAVDRSQSLFFLSAFLYGGFTFSLYPLCVSHSNDHTQPEEFVRTASGLLLVYGVGAAIGPILAGFLMGAFSEAVFFIFLLANYTVLTLCTLYRMLSRAAPGTEQQAAFSMLTRTSQSALEMLPDVAGKE